MSTVEFYDELPREIQEEAVKGWSQVKNFLIESEAAGKLNMDCPPGFTQLQDECVQDEEE